MPTDILAAAAALTDRQLLARVELLAGRERETSAELVAHLAELDARRIHEAEGFRSLFLYCTLGLRLSEDAAYTRIEAARAARRFPCILELLANGSLTLTAVRLLAPHLTPENSGAVLKEATGLSKRQVEVLVARLAPRPDVAPSVRKLPVPGAAKTPIAMATILAASADLLPRAPIDPEASQSPPVPRPMTVTRPAVAPLAPERYKVTFTIAQATREKLQMVQDLLRREVPDGDPGAIFDRALTLILEDVARKKFAKTPRPRATTPAKPSSGSRHVPAAVKRAVWLRDRGQCGFKAVRSGRRCAERSFLEFHHVEPYAIGGEMTVANISLRCRRHNAYEAERAFGDLFRNKFGPGETTSATAPPSPAVEGAVESRVRIADDRAKIRCSAGSPAGGQ